jgi:HK97 family phage prohead protease
MRGTTGATADAPAPQAGTVDLLPLCVRAEVASVNDEKRTVELVFSTGAPVTRMDYWTGKRYVEKLSLKPEHLRLDRMNAGAPLLDAHSAFSITDQIGVVESGSVKLTAKEARATVRFSKRAEVDSIWGDVRDGIIRNVSVGYRVHKFLEDDSADDKIPVRTAVDWEPYEVSMVPLPADPGARVREGVKSDTNQCVIVVRTESTEDADRQRRFRLAMAR